MEICCRILQYLEKKQYLLGMRGVCRKYLEDLNEKNARKFPPLRFLLRIDVMDLIDFNPDLGHNLLKEPVSWQKKCSEILYACLITENDDPVITEIVKPTQVAVNLRFESFPTSLLQPNPRYYTGMIWFNGLLVSLSKPSSYVYHTVWSCPQECTGNEIIEQYIPKVPPKCFVCKSTLFENSGLRRCGEQVAATFKLKNDLIPRSFGIVDDQISKLQLGAQYNIYAVTMRNKVKVWCLENTSTLPAPITAVIPADVKQLYNACKGIPWLFIYCLASSIGVNFCPLSCFMHLKVSLLLSLASVQAHVQSGAKILHVLAAGFDTGHVGRLMQEGAKLAERHMCLGTSYTTSPAALIGCSGGVCVMPLPIHSYSQRLTYSVLSTMESGYINTDTSKTNLQCAVWAQGNNFEKVKLVNVASVFGTICRGDFGEYNDEIVELALENAVEQTRTTKEEVKVLRDVALYIDLVAGMQVALGSRTETLLKNYFLTARKERPRGVTAVSMDALIATCLTSARLCQRSVTNIDDAVLAIWLHVSGSPEPRMAPEEYLQTPADVKRLEKIIGDFKEWLTQFTGAYI